MNGSIRTLLLTIVLALMTTAAAAQDLPSETVGPPLILRLKGVVEPTPEAASHTDGFAVVSLGFLGDGAPAHRWLGVDDARTVGGDNRLDGKSWRPRRPDRERVGGAWPSHHLAAAMSEPCTYRPA